MKSAVTLSLAAAIAFGLTASAQAWQLPSSAYHDRAENYVSESAYRVDGFRYGHHAPNCVGLSSGTAHPACGSMTGGPSGGLN